jgi:UDP-N-acetylmuramoyl-L-alanyl-D-glutamate--2,6-diaminopimelate ligase
LLKSANDIAKTKGRDAAVNEIIGNYKKYVNPEEQGPTLEEGLAKQEEEKIPEKDKEAKGSFNRGFSAGLSGKTAAITNFTQDHLDYHKTMEEYFKAKMILFEQYVAPNGFAIVNSDIPEFDKIHEICYKKNLQVISYGKKPTSAKHNILIEKIILHDNGQDIDLHFNNKKFQVKTNLIGEFQAYNLVASMALVYSLGFNFEEIVSIAEKITPVKGRMDIIFAEKMQAKIVIDYAHTPDALEKALENLRIQTSGRLICLFGCGGDRDISKRPLMGRIASEKADIVIVTDDNPRTEDAAKIRQEILNGAQKKVMEIADRKNAISEAISLLKANDSLLLAGKGHEDYQIIGKQKFLFDEFKIVKEILDSNN